MNEIDFLGYRITNATFAECINYIDNSILQDDVIQIVPFNANKLYKCRFDKKLMEISRTASLIIPEYAIVWGAKKLGTPLVEHIGGIMLMRRLLELSSKKPYRFYFLGAKEEIVSKMIELLPDNYPGIHISGWQHGYFDSEKEIVEKVVASNANILLVALGTPKQEYFIKKHLQDFGVNIVMGVGGSFDVFAGLRKETPSRWRKGFEWIYRLAQDPLNFGYWKRYFITNPWFVYQVYKNKLLKGVIK